jgi:hypothetical protein
MVSEIPEQIAILRALPRSELLDLWQELYKKAAPHGVRREILIPFLAYKIQENACGGLKPKILAELHRITKALDRNRTSKDSLIRPRLKTGIRLFRKWRGHTHEVFIADSGYEYGGATYRSLSEIARKITGTRWSGPAFFGLKKVISVSGSQR